MVFTKDEIVYYPKHPYNEAWSNKKFKFVSYIDSRKISAFVILLEDTDGLNRGREVAIGVECLKRFRKSKSHLPVWW